jgi:oligopeptide transport system permease protein
MLKLVLAKFFSFLITFFLLVSASFFLLRLLPGSPFDEGRFLSPEILANMEAKYGLDQDLITQYCRYISKLFLHADLGPSLKYPNRDVNDILFNALPISLELGLCAFLIALIGGVVLGTLSALYPHKAIGRLVSLISGVSMSVPSFIFAGILIGIFGLWLNLLPVALWEGPEYMILPVLTLSIAPLAYITRITRSTVIDTLNKEFVKTALAKGQREIKIIINHVLPNCLIPILTVAGPLVAILITGSFVVEYIFALPGMGKYFVTAFINRDYFLVSGTVVIFSIILLTVNTCVDLMILALSPKSRA